MFGDGGVDHALGAELVCDDQVSVKPHPDGGLWATPPSRSRGLIEARGVGLLAQPECSAIVKAAVDLDQIETQRLPPAREIVIAGVKIPLLYRVESPAFASILFVYLKGQRYAP